MVSPLFVSDKVMFNWTLSLLFRLTPFDDLGQVFRVFLWDIPLLPASLAWSSVSGFPLGYPTTTCISCFLLPLGSLMTWISCFLFSHRISHDLHQFISVCLWKSRDLTWPPALKSHCSGILLRLCVTRKGNRREARKTRHSHEGQTSEN